jgi:hypothetical protein
MNEPTANREPSPASSLDARLARATLEPALHGLARSQVLRLACLAEPGAGEPETAP